MQINLKQTEITEALQQYIAQKGIDLRGKTVEIAFTAGRKEGGLTAEINIRERGHVTVYGNNEGVTAWFKIRTEMADKAIKMLAELGLVARGRPKLKAKVSDVDELFATA